MMPRRFGKLFSRTVDGQVYAQPLYVSGLEMQGKRTHNVLFVATAHNTIYAFDAENADGANDKPLWSRSLLQFGPSNVKRTPVPSHDYDFTIGPHLISQKYRDLTPEIGITGTPVISPDHKTIYAVAATKEGSLYVHRLHALDTATGEETQPPVEIRGSVPGIGDSSVNNSVRFMPRQHLQRPALLWSRGIVYVAFGSHGDLPVNKIDLGHIFDLLPGYHGWVFAYDAKTLQCLDIFNSTPNGGSNVLDSVDNIFAGGGIWMSGAGPAADDAGNIYFSTGNGTFTAARPGGTEYADSIVKLRFDTKTGKLAVEDFFTPHSQAFLETKDLDLGSCGVLLLPENVGTDKHKNLVVFGGKEGRLYLADQKKLGGYNSKVDNCLQNFLAAYSTQETRNAMAHKSTTVTAPASTANTPQRRQEPFHKVRKTQAHIEMDKKMAGQNRAMPSTSAQGRSGFEISNIHSAPVFWQSPVGPLVYIWGEEDVLKAFQLIDGCFRSNPQAGCADEPKPVGQGTPYAPPGMPGAMLSLSAHNSDAGTGLLWAALPKRRNANHDTVEGVLRVFDATPANGKLDMLWWSQGDAADEVGDFAKFCPPTIANGKVFLATFSCQVEVYGLLDDRNVVSPVADTFVQAGKYADQPRTMRLNVLQKELVVSRSSSRANASGNSCAYLKFDLTSLTKVPKSALLSLHVYQRESSSGEVTVHVYGLASQDDQRWREETLTWNNALNLNQTDFTARGSSIASHRVFANEGNITFDITQFVAAHLGSVVTLQLAPDPKSNGGITFLGKKASDLLRQPINAQSLEPDMQKEYKAGEPLLILTWY